MLNFCMYEMNYPSHGLVSHVHWGGIFPNVTFEVLNKSFQKYSTEIYPEKKCGMMCGYKKK